MKNLYLILIVLLPLCGCAKMAETFFAHYRMTDDGVRNYASLNAAINVCLANRDYGYNEVSDLNYYAAKMIDLAVLDEELFESIYKKSMDDFMGLTKDQLSSNCEKMRPHLSQITANISNEYRGASQSVVSARQVEMNSIANSLNSFGNSAQTIGQQSAINYKIPEVNFKPESANKVDLYLINTNSGLRQCRVTSKNYVFCL